MNVGHLINYRPHTKDGEGNVFSLSTGGEGAGGTYPKVPTPTPARSGQGGGVPQGAYLLPRCLHLPVQVRMGGGRDIPRYLPPPPPRYLPPPIQVRKGRWYPKVPTPAKIPTPPPSRSGWGRGRGYPKVPTPPSQGTYPPPGIGQHICLLRSRRRTFLFQNIPTFPCWDRKIGDWEKVIHRSCCD